MLADFHFLRPEWLYLAALLPFFFVVRTQSLTDLSVAQQLVQSSFRSLVLAGIAIALARPAWMTSDDKVATVVLADVSESVSDKQLAATSAYIAQLDDDVLVDEDLSNDPEAFGYDVELVGMLSLAASF